MATKPEPTLEERVRDAEGWVSGAPAKDARRQDAQDARQSAKRARALLALVAIGNLLPFIVLALVLRSFSWGPGFVNMAGFLVQCALVGVWAAWTVGVVAVGSISTVRRKRLSTRFVGLLALLGFEAWIIVKVIEMSPIAWW